MKTFNVSDDIVPVGEFKTNMSKHIKNVQKTGHPLIITQNGRPAAVLLSPIEYDELTEKKLFIESVNRGISDADQGNIYTTEEVKKILQRRRVAEKSE